MSEHFKGIPYAPPINPFRPGSFREDVKRTIALKRDEFLFRKEQTALGLEEDAKKFGWRMIIGNNDLELHSQRDRLYGSIEHAVLLFLSPRMLVDIYKGLGKFGKLRANLKAGFQEPCA